MQIEICQKAGNQLLLRAAQSPPKPLVPNSSPAWHQRSQFYGPGMSKVSVSYPLCSGGIKPEPLSQPHTLGTGSARRGGTSLLTRTEGQLHPKRCQRGWTGHPFCRQATENTKCKICLFPTSTVLWTLWWVSSAINTSLKGRCLLERGLRKWKRRLGGLGCVMQNLPSESQRSCVTSVGRDLPWTLSPKREAVATEVKERTTELCYPETRGSL